MACGQRGRKEVNQTPGDTDTQTVFWAGSTVSGEQGAVRRCMPSLCAPWPVVSGDQSTQKHSALEVEFVIMSLTLLGSFKGTVRAQTLAPSVWVQIPVVPRAFLGQPLCLVSALRWVGLS